MGIEEKLQHEVMLGPLTTLGVGGPARRYAETDSEDEVEAYAALAMSEGWPLFLLGGGSNVLISDAGLDALVLRWSGEQFDSREDGDDVLVQASAGCDWDSLVARAVAAGWAGIECLSGIPGTVGAAPIQNIGAYGQELSEVLEEVSAIHLPDARRHRLSAADCGFGYRDSRFKRESGWVVTEVRLRLKRGGAPTLRYGELTRCLAERTQTPSLDDVRQAVLEIRASKGMVLDRADSESRSAGSFFTNPIVDAATARDIAARFRDPMPNWPDPDGDACKLSAAWLIEHCGVERGHARGAARVSRKHVLALVNGGGATAAELLLLAREIHDRVLEQTGLSLRPEPRLLGFTPAELGPLAATFAA